MPHKNTARYPMSKHKSSSKSIIRVGVADKSPLVQAALLHLFAEDQRFELVDVWADGESMLKSIDQCALNIVVTGWIISPGNAKYILDQLRAHANAPRIIVYSGAEGESVPAQVMAHGGAAFVSKREQPEYLLDTVAAVAEGRMVFPFLDVRKIHRNPLTSLTKRELEVLSTLAAGHTNKQIAAAHGVSPNTVKFHIKNLFEKLGVNNRGQAIALYLRS
jgi:two-component system nitrate/nitrite response regulator NarP